MTETEIMKEIETLLRIAKFVDSDYVTSPIETKLLVAIQDLINRKNEEIESLQIKKEHLVVFLAEAKAEVERLKAVEESHKKLNGELRKEVERLTVNMNAFGLGMKRESERADTARAEAIKEFAEKIYRSCAMYGQKDKFNKTVFLKIVDKIAKEMGVDL